MVFKDGSLGYFQAAEDMTLLDDKTASKRPVSGRRVIAVKGYQHHVGRGIEALKALEMCHDQLQDYEIVVHTAHPPTEKEAERLAFRRNLKIAVFPQYIS